MHFAQSLVMASAMATAASAFPMERRDNSTGAKFTVNQIVSNVNQGKKLAGPVALARTIGKYGKVGAQVPQVVKVAAAKAVQSDDGTVTANPTQYDSQYLETVTIGKQQFQLDFDTGSSDLWVFSKELPSNERGSHSLYTPGSTAKKVSGATWKIQYGDQSSASGDVYTDTVSIGDTTVTAQAVEAASAVSASFVQDQSDGLVGLAFSSINTVKPKQQKTFFDNAATNLDQPLFTANLKKGQPGNYNFGYIDNSEYTGDISYTAVDNSQGFWGYTTDSYTVGNGQPVQSSIQSISDTGTSLVLVDDAIVSDYWGQVDGATNSQNEGGYIFPCDAQLPDISFTIGDYTGTIPGDYINYAPASENGQCFGGIQSNAGVGLSIFGDVWLKSQFVVYSNNGQPQLGHAKKA